MQNLHRMYRGAYLRALKATTGDPGPHKPKEAARQVIQMAGWRVKEGGKIRPMTREEIGEQLLHG
jgi:hypothetical protein